MDCKNFFNGKRVTLMGLGLLGRGIGDAACLASWGAQVTVTDKKTSEELASSLSQLVAFPSIVYHLGGHQEEDFTSADMVIKAAGVPLDSPYIAAAEKAGVPVYMSTALFTKFARERGALVIGVTGTRGKSTTTHMIHHGLLYAGRRAHLGGNVRGVSTLALLPEVREGDVVVLELDSWQLQGFGSLRISPDIAVFTNLMPDHMNYYHNDMGRYCADKKHIYEHQDASGVLIVGEEVQREWLHEPRAVVATSYEGQLKVQGGHNARNAACAEKALLAAGVFPKHVAEGLISFGGVEGRLQWVREVRGVALYNDNNATTPDATIAALRALTNGKKNIILIMGGSDKGLDMSALLYEVAIQCKRVILLTGTGTERITPFMADFSLYDTVEAAVAEAVRGATAGDVVLFSPAFASFGMFSNEYERNDAFLRAAAAVE